MSEQNMVFYDRLRSVPKEAQKEIGAGRLKGFTDINPMWRIKALTETFGPCGIGWAYTINRQWLESAPNGEVAAFVEIGLVVKVDGEWSLPIPGVGGNMFVAQERSGTHVSDECFKMALSDAISVAAKALGVGADIYYAKDRTKYTTPSDTQPSPSQLRTAAPAPAPATKKPAPAQAAAPERKYATQMQVDTINRMCTQVEVAALLDKYKVRDLRMLDIDTADKIINKLFERTMGGQTA